MYTISKHISRSCFSILLTFYISQTRSSLYLNFQIIRLVLVKIKFVYQKSLLKSRKKKSLITQITQRTQNQKGQYVLQGQGQVERVEFCGVFCFQDRCRVGSEQSFAATAMIKAAGTIQIIIVKKQMVYSSEKFALKNQRIHTMWLQTDNTSPNKNSQLYQDNSGKRTHKRQYQTCAIRPIVIAQSGRLSIDHSKKQSSIFTLIQFPTIFLTCLVYSLHNSDRQYNPQAKHSATKNISVQAPTYAIPVAKTGLFYNFSISYIPTQKRLAINFN
eukprot:TRINITY_DN23084_c0_g1_i7.p1 TRINITY_DN23084_c0_g1~~TRINITY_DN23084_c0_g1_i7.p1  ORF type:complete len:273 (+),score=-5.18 TRINITY_DN23084_c0_g1_i7:1183-2001(+)